FGNLSQTYNRLRCPSPEGNQESNMLGLRPIKPASFELSPEEPHTNAKGDSPLVARMGSEIERLRGVIAQLMHTTAHDPLTGLPTRSMLLERVEHELSRQSSDGTQIALLFVDLDN